MCSSSGDYRSQMPFWVALEPIVWWSRLGWQAKTPYGWVGLTPAKRLPFKRGGLYIGSPNEKGCHQGASSPCKFPTISVSFSSLNKTYRHYGIADCHQRQSPGLKECSGEGHVPTPNPTTMLNGPKNLYFQAMTSWDWPGGHIFGWECSPNHLW